MWSPLSTLVLETGHWATLAGQQAYLHLPELSLHLHIALLFLVVFVHIFIAFVHFLS